MMRVFSSNLDIIQQAAVLLRAGRLISMPTETVYGLAGSAENDAAIASIYAAKGRPAFNPLIVHVASEVMANRYGELGGIAATLAKEFWPAPLTLVVSRHVNSPLSLLVSAGMDSVALRMPAHPVARALIEAAGVGLAAPSANRSGRISPTTAQHVAEEFEGQNEPVMILDGGACVVGVESTVVDCTGEIPLILRHGAITLEMLRAVIPSTQIYLATGEGFVVKSPGMLQSHYAPNLRVRLNVREVLSTEALLAYGAHVPHGAACTVNLSETGDVVEAAANLFAYMRLVDKPDYSAIAVMPIPDEGLGMAINDRLRRAAAPR